MQPLSSLPTYTSISPSRLQSLYSDLSRQKVSNPASFQSNVDWWHHTLAALTLRASQPASPDTLVLHAGKDLADHLRYEGAGKPLGLTAVITELRGTHALIPLPSFLDSTASIYDVGSLPYRVAAYIVGRPISWALQQLSLDGADSSSSANTWSSVQGPYVLVRNVDKAAETLLLRHRESVGVALADSLYSSESFRRKFGRRGIIFPDVSLSDTDLKVLIVYLCRDKKAAVEDKDIVKFVDDVSHETITVVDKGILELKTGVENLEAQVDDIQQKIHERTEKITDALRAKRKEVAMTHLRSRKLLEETLTRRLGSLEVLQGTLMQVETAAGDIEIMKQYTSSTATLRTLLAHPALQRDAVDATMNAMAEARAEEREIGEAIAAGAGEDGVDEVELEAELAALVEEARREGEKEARSGVEVTLPSVPIGPPVDKDPAHAELETARALLPALLANASLSPTTRLHSGLASSATSTVPNVDTPTSLSPMASSNDVARHTASPERSAQPAKDREKELDVGS